MSFLLDLSLRLNRLCRATITLFGGEIAQIQPHSTIHHPQAITGRIEETHWGHAFHPHSLLQLSLGNDGGGD